MTIEELVPKEAVPNAEGQVDQQVDQVEMKETVVTGGKRYSKREADFLASIGALKEGSIIEEEVTTKAAPTAEAETIPEPQEAGLEDTVEVEKEPPLEDNEYIYGNFEGCEGIKTRKNKKTGKSEIRIVIDEVEEWITPEAYHRNVQLNVHNQREAQRLAGERKKIEEQKEIDGIINRFTSSKREKIDDDTEEPEDEETPKKSRSSDVDAELKKELAELREERKKFSAQREADEILKKTTEKMAITYNQVREFYKDKGLELPEQPDNRIVARVKAYAENKGINPVDVATDNVFMVEALKSYSVKASVRQEPPKALKAKSGPEEPSTLGKLLADKEALKKEYNNPMADSGLISAKIISLQKEIDKVKKGK